MEEKIHFLKRKLESGKWWTYGRLYKNKYGHLTVSLRATEQLRKALNDTRYEYLNFSVFEDDGDFIKKKKEESNQQEVEKDNDILEDDWSDDEKF